MKSNSYGMLEFPESIIELKVRPNIAIEYYSISAYFSDFGCGFEADLKSSIHESVLSAIDNNTINSGIHVVNWPSISPLTRFYFVDAMKTTLDDIANRLVAVCSPKNGRLCTTHKTFAEEFGLAATIAGLAYECAKGENSRLIEHDNREKLSSPTAAPLYVVKNSSAASLPGLILLSIYEN